jgi:hypothetical protein
VDPKLSGAPAIGVSLISNRKVRSYDTGA